LLDEIVIGESPVENYDVVQKDGSLIVDRMYDVGFSRDEVVSSNYAL
jgi:hypothetical protein